MEILLETILLSASLFIVTFLLGMLPSKISASRKVMNLISIFGAGLLVGAALIVIVPEGMIILVQSMQKVKPHSHDVPAQNGTMTLAS